MSFDVIGSVGKMRKSSSPTSGRGVSGSYTVLRVLMAVVFGSVALFGVGIIGQGVLAHLMTTSARSSSSSTFQTRSSPYRSTQVLGSSNIGDGLFTFNIPTLFKSLLTAAVIQVNGDASIGGNLSVSGETTLAEMLVTGTVQLQDDVTGDNIDLDIGTGELTASNVVYSVAAGSGISVSGTQDLTISNTDKGSDQKMFRTMKVGDTSITAGSNSDTFTIAAGSGITLSANDGDKKLTIGADSGSLNISGFSDTGGSIHLTTPGDKVGIGTNTPSTTLHVVGDTTLDGTLTVTGVSTLHGINNSGDGITNAGSITGATGLTSSGTITFSGLSTGVVKSSLAGVLSSSAVDLASADVTGTLPTTSGGTGVTSYTTGDLLYGSATNTLSTLGIGGSGEVLTVSGGIPTWGTITGSGGLCPSCLLTDPGSTQTITPTSATATGLSVRQATSGSVDIFNVTSSTGAISYLRVDSSGNVILGAGGTSSIGNFTVNPSGTDPIAFLATAQGANAYTGTITTADLTADRTWTLPDASGSICLTTGNCNGVGGNFGGTGTTNSLAKFTTSTTVGNSILYDDGTQIGINDSTPSYVLDVNGTGRFVGALTAGSTLGVTGNTTLSGTLQTTGATSLLSTLDVTGTTTLSSTLGVTSNTTIGGTLGVTGNATFDSTTLYVDALNHRVGVGTTTPAVTFDVAGNAANSIQTIFTRSADPGFQLVTSNGNSNSPNTLQSYLGLRYAGINNATAGINFYRGSGTVDSYLGLKTNGTEKMTILANGNVGIGTTSPSEPLQVAGGARFGSAPATLTTLTGGVDAIQATMTVVSTAGYPASTGTLLIDSEAMAYTGTTATTFTGVTRGVLGTTAATHTSGTSVNNYLMTSIATATTPKMVVTGSGNVGIGLVNPRGKLDISSSADGNSTDALELFNPTVSANVSTNIAFSTNGSARTTVARMRGIDTGSSVGAITFETNTGVQASDTTSEVMRLISGNVGIGTATPQSTLHVAAAPTATANYGAVSLGSGAFDGSTSGFFAGSASGTQLAMNTASSYAGSLEDFQNNGNSIWKVSSVASAVNGFNFTTAAAGNAVTLAAGGGSGSDANIGLNLNSKGTGPVTLTSSNAVGTAASSAFVFTDNALTTGTGGYFNSSSLTTGKLLQLSTGAANTLTSGTLADIRTTATSLTGTAGIGSLLNLDWSPGSATTAIGDLFAINIGANGTIGNLFNVLNNGSSLFSVSQAQITASVPTAFTAPGDVGMAYDLAFTNPVASFIKSNASLYLQAGETFNSSDLVLKTFNQGAVVIDSGVTTSNIVDITNSTLTTGNALNISATALTTGKLVNLSTTFAGSAVTGYGLYNAGTDSTAVANTDYQQYISLLLSGNAAKTGVGLFSTVGTSSTTADTLVAADLATTNTGVMITGTRNVFGLRTQPTSTAASSGGTENYYGFYSAPSTTLGAGATINNYGGYIGGTATVASGAVNRYGLYIANAAMNTTGTSTQYGLYVAPVSGATTNYAAIFEGGNVGIGTATPTHALTLPTASTGIALYNTSDQTTNYERGALSWTSNNLILNIQKGGTGTQRGMKFATNGTNSFGIDGANNSFHIYGNALYFSGDGSFGAALNLDSQGGFAFTSNVSAAADITCAVCLGNANNIVKVGGTTSYIAGVQTSNTFAPASGTSKFIGLNIKPTINQTGSATGDYTGLQVNVAETAATGINKLLADFQTGGASKMVITSAGNLGLGTTAFGTNAAKVLGIAGSTAPTTGITDGIQFWAEDVAGSHELRVMDEAGNITTLSPHNFSLIPQGRSEDLAWGFYSQRGSLAINADMTKALRLVEKMSGEQLIYIKDVKTGQDINPTFDQQLMATPSATLAPTPTTSDLLASGSISGIAKWSYNVWHFVGEVIVDGITTFKNTVKFEKPVEFADTVVFKNLDLGGLAKIKTGDQFVKISFSKAFTQRPIINVIAEDSFKAYTLKNVSVDGFEIWLNTPAATDMMFNWSVMIVDGMQTVESTGSATVSSDTSAATSSATATSSAVPSVSPTPTPTPTPSPTSSAEPVALP